MLQDISNEEIVPFTGQDQCIKSHKTLEEMENPQLSAGCWDYVISNDAYYDRGPSSRFESSIKKRLDIENMSKKTVFIDPNDPGVTLTKQCVEYKRDVAGTEFIALECESMYKYSNTETGDIIEGIAHRYTHCLYQLDKDNFYYYGINYASIGSEIDACGDLIDKGFKKITIEDL